MKAGRKPEIPYSENFFVTSTKAVLLIKSMHHYRSRSIHVRTKSTACTDDKFAIRSQSLSGCDMLERCCTCDSANHESRPCKSNNGWSKEEERNYCPQCSMFTQMELETSI